MLLCRSRVENGAGIRSPGNGLNDVELRTLAQTILESDDLGVKLSCPDGELTDHVPGPARVLLSPTRPRALRIRSSTNVPPIEGMQDPAQRGRILHALANHEFQAVELFAWALLAFPDTPTEFRRGLAAILKDEQRHTRMYIARVEANGLKFGDAPVSGYFWNKIPNVHTPTQFVCTMSLTFENANLDHTIEYSRAAREIGDEATAKVIEQVHEDEIEHVRFGWHWLQIFKDDNESTAEAYKRSIVWPLRLARARGRTFHPCGRERAGIETDFIELLAKSSVDVEPQGPDRATSGEEENNIP